MFVKDFCLLLFFIDIFTRWATKSQKGQQKIKHLTLNNVNQSRIDELKDKSSTYSINLKYFRRQMFYVASIELLQLFLLSPVWNE